jgi:hypothetical protein
MLFFSLKPSMQTIKTKKTTIYPPLKSFLAETPLSFEEYSE